MISNGSRPRTLSTLALLLALSGCGGVRVLDGRIEHPAELPVRSFAPVIVAPSQDPDSTDVAHLVAANLVRGGTYAEVLGESTGAPSSGLVLELVVRMTSRVDTIWATRPESICSIGGCYTRYMQYPTYVSTVVATADLRVRDASSARLLAARNTHAEALGNDSAQRRAELRRTLVTQISSWFDPHDEVVQVRFPRGEGELFARARTLAARGLWDDARGELETLRASDRFATMRASSRADVLEALALCARFGSAAHAEPARAVSSALALVDEAIEIEPSDARVELRDALRLQQAEADVLQLQRSGDDAVSQLPVPESYR